MVNKKVLPDGGWGWMVVAGAAVTNLFNQSLLSLFGLIFGEQLESMGHTTTGIAFVMNINSMVTNFSGLITGPILKNYSSRLVAILGVLLSSIGMFLCSFATNIYVVILGYSIFTGLGLGLIMPSTFVAVNSYFSPRKRSHAVGISMVGTSLGQMIMPQVAQFLLEEYGYRGTILILGALCMNGLPGALLFHPVEWHMKIMKPENSSLLEKSKTIEVDNNKVENVKNEVITEKKPNTPIGVWGKMVQLWDLELLNDFVFVHIIVGLAFVYTCSIAFSMLFPFFLQEEINLNRKDTATCMSLLSGADIFARLTIPFITSYFDCGNRVTFIIGGAFLILARSFLAEQTTFEMIIIASLLCGYVRAGTVINQNLTVSEYCAETKLPAALGLNMITKGLFVLSLGQLLGWTRDYFQSYRLSIHFQSIIILFVVLTWSLEHLLIAVCNTEIVPNKNRSNILI